MSACRAIILQALFCFKTICEMMEQFVGGNAVNK